MNVNTINRIIFSLLVGVATFGMVSVASAADLNQTQYEQVVVKKLQAKKSIVLKGTKASIQQKGSRALKIKDKLTVTGKATFKKNVTVQGTLSVNALEVNGQEYTPAQDELPTNCSTNQVIKYTGTAWSCAADIDTNTYTDTTYTAGTGLELSGTVFSAEGTGFDNVIIVAKSGGDFTSIQSAIDSIADASASAPYTVWVAPGTYSEQVTLKANVHLQGASNQTTFVTFSGGASLDSSAATVTMSDSSSIDSIAIASVATGTNGLAVYAGSGTPKISNSTLTVDSGSAKNTGVYIDSTANITVEDTTISSSGSVVVWGVYLEDTSSATLDNITVDASNGSTDTFGIYNTSSSTMKLVDSDITADGDAGASAIGIYVLGSSSNTIYGSRISGIDAVSADIGLNTNGGTTLVHDSEIIGDLLAIQDQSGTLNIATTKLDGGGSADTCVGAYDETFTILSITCS